MSERKTVYVNLAFNPSLNHLPFDKWEPIEMVGQFSKSMPADIQAIGFALEMSGLEKSEYPTKIYTCDRQPCPGVCVVGYTVEPIQAPTVQP
jgi:hypothetical protein